MNFWCVTPFFIKRLIKINAVSCVLCYHNQNLSSSAAWADWIAKNIVCSLNQHSQGEAPAVDFTGVCCYLHSPQTLEGIMFWQHRIYSPNFFRYACLNCLFFNTVSLSPEFSLQPHPSNVDSPTIPSLYMFIPMSLGCNYYCHFSVVPICSDIAPEDPIWFSLFKWFLFLISCSSYHLSPIFLHLLSLLTSNPILTPWASHSPSHQNDSS